VRDRERPRGVTGCGAAGNPNNRFERIAVEPNPSEPVEEASPEIVYLRDVSRSITARNDGPDIGFEASINPYRGASMGAVTATLARPTSTLASQRAWTSRARSS
jgi:hypothetical protein